MEYREPKFWRDIGWPMIKVFLIGSLLSLPIVLWRFW